MTYKRKAVYAGMFYPSPKEELTAALDNFFNNGDLPSGIKPVAVISPHAGYAYSGVVAAYSYNLLKFMKPDLVVILAPSHRVYLDGASVIPEGFYQTPLGDVPIDPLAARLVNEPFFSFNREIENLEHSLEVQIPFLQHVLHGFSIIPIVIGTHDFEKMNSIAGSIYNIMKDFKGRYSIVISTDLSHFHDYDTANKIDAGFIGILTAFDEKALHESLLSEKYEACGHAPLITGMLLSRMLGATRIDVLKYMNSGDSSGDKRKVVGYLAGAIS
jgi:MEMO1 family protein